MGKTLIKFACIIVLTFSILLGQAFAQDEVRFRTVPQFIFGVGETMEFTINYGVISAGVATIRIKDFVLAGDRICFRIQSEARSRKFFDPFFKVRDHVESWMDVKGLFSWRFEKNLNEGKYHDHKVVTYDYEAGHATVIDDGVPKDTTMLRHEVQDGISCLFWARLLPIKTDTVLTIETLDIKKIYQLKVRVLGIDTVNTPAGSFRCYKVEPFLEGEGIFKKDKAGKIWLWFTNDALRIPVMLQTKVFFGHITARLTDYTPGKPLPKDLSIIREELLGRQSKNAKAQTKEIDDEGEY